MKGHSGDRMNDLVDRLAVEAATTQRGRTGEGEPGDLGPADDVSWSARAGAGRSTAEDLAELPELDLSNLDLPDAEGRSGPALARPRSVGRQVGSGGSSPSPAPAAVPAPVIDGHALVVLGHRPTELGGYGDNPLADAVRGRLAEVVAAKAEMYGDLVVVSGLRLGAEMMGAEVAAELDVPLWPVLPYPDPDSVWPSESQGALQGADRGRPRRGAAAEEGARVEAEGGRRAGPARRAGWCATSTRRCWCGTASTPGSARCSARSRTVWATTCG